MPEKLLSELIELVGVSKEDYIRFLQTFRRSRVGVVAHGNTGGRAGTVQSTSENPFTLGSSKDPEGRLVILAFADPPAFIQRFGQRFNAEMDGEDVLKTALANPDCHGVLVNSAMKEVSALIERRTVQLMLTGGGAPVKETRPWWKFW